VCVFVLCDATAAPREPEASGVIYDDVPGEEPLSPDEGERPGPRLCVCVCVCVRACVCVCAS